MKSMIFSLGVALLVFAGLVALDQQESPGGRTIAISPFPSSVRYIEQYDGPDAGARIQAAIASLPLTGGTVDARGLEGAQTISSNPWSGVTKPVTLLLGHATYTVSAILDELPSHTTIMGLGAGRTIFQQGDAADLPAILRTAASVSDIRLLDFTIDGNRAAQTDTTNQKIIISLRAMTNGEVRGVEIRDVIGRASGSPNVALASSGGVNVRIESVRITNVGTVGGGAGCDAIFTSGTRTRISNNYISGAGDTAIVAETSTDPIITGNTIVGSAQGIAVDSGVVSTTTTGGIIQGNVITGGGPAANGAQIFLFKGFGEENSRIVVSGNVVRNTTNSVGIQVSGSKYVSVVGNVIEGTSPAGAKHGILVTLSSFSVVSGNGIHRSGGSGLVVTGSTDISISGNVLTNNGATAPGTYSAIVIADASGQVPSTGIVVSGNRATDTAARAADKSQAWGAVVSGTSSALIGPNYFTGNRTGSVSVRSSGTVIRAGSD